MEETKVLQINLVPVSPMANTLHQILKSCENPRIEARQEDYNATHRDFAPLLSHFNPDLIFLVLGATDVARDHAVIHSLSTAAEGLPIVVLTEAEKPEDMIGLLRMGAVDFINPPITPVDVLPRIWRLLEQRRPREASLHSLKETIGLKQLVGQDRAFAAEIEKIPIVAKCDANVLILGETGTGKELCGRAIHYLSPRASKAFVPVNCGAIPLELVENELFGHAKGAFTGASKAFSGLIHEADGGTLFLDEIDCLPLQAQVKFLRFLQDKEYKPLGSSKLSQADVRVIVASNIDLDEAVSEGKFRRDLFYRLNIVPITLPPLRDRKEDIPLLARHFLEIFASEFKKRVVDFTSEALQKLLTYEWPGNVRELENVVERAIIFSKGHVIQDGDIILPHLKNVLQQETFHEAKSRAITQFEKRYIQDLLLAYGGNITRAAKAAQKNRRAFWELIRKYKIDVRSYKPGPLEHLDPSGPG